MSAPRNMSPIQFLAKEGFFLWQNDLNRPAETNIWFYLIWFKLIWYWLHLNLFLLNSLHCWPLRVQYLWACSNFGSVVNYHEETPKIFYFCFDNPLNFPFSWYCICRDNNISYLRPNHPLFHLQRRKNWRLRSRLCGLTWNWHIGES